MGTADAKQFSTATVAPSPDNGPAKYRVTEIRLSGTQEWKQHTLSASELRQLTGLRMRDLRFLDPIGRSGILIPADAVSAGNASCDSSSSSAAAAGDAPSAVATHVQQCILTLPNLKMIIGHDRAFIFETRIPIVKRMRQLLASHLLVLCPPAANAADAAIAANTAAAAAPSFSGVPFGVAALENALVLVYRDLRNQVILTRKTLELVGRRLNDLSDTGSASTLSSMLAVSKTAAQLLATLNDSAATANALLRSDEDVQHLARVLTSDPGAKHDELEFILEEHARCISGAAAQLSLAIEALDASQQYYRIRMSDVRNQLLRASLATSICGFSVAAGALVVGVFGQNLHSGMEHEPHAFYAATSAAFLVCVLQCTQHTCVARTCACARARVRARLRVARLQLLFVKALLTGTSVAGRLCCTGLRALPFRLLAILARTVPDS